MSEIKDKIKNCTKQKRYIFGDGWDVLFSGSKLTRYITIMSRIGFAITMKIVIVPFTEKAICRDIWTITPSINKPIYIVKNQIRLCTLDDVENWIMKYFQKG